MGSLTLLADALRSAWHILWANRLRTVLTALSVALGAGAISLMVSLSKSGVTTITHSIEEVGGSHLIFLYQREPKAKALGGRYDRGITLADAAEVRFRVPGLLDAAYLMSLKQQTVTGNGKKADIDLAIGSSYRFYLSQRLEAGVDLPPDDAAGVSAEGLQRITVCGHDVAVELFGSAEEALKNSIVVFGHRYQIIGVSTLTNEEGFQFGGISKRRVCFFPAPTMLYDEGVIDRGMLVLKDDGQASHDYLIRVANAVMLERHRGVDDFEFFDFAKLLRKFENVFLGLRILTGLIAALSLLIAGAGIMNVLLASIRQRVSEIGIRRAVGATAVDIRRQFLTESMLIAGLGGLIGSSVGIALAFAGGWAIHLAFHDWIVSVSPESAFIAVFASVLSGLIFGLQPARRAARLSVTACLRGD